MRQIQHPQHAFVVYLYNQNQHSYVSSFKTHDFVVLGASAQCMQPCALKSRIHREGGRDTQIRCRKGSRVYKDPLTERFASCVNMTDRTQVDVAFGCGGVGVRPSYFDERIFTHEVDGSFYVDDLHISGNLRRNGVDIYTEPCKPSEWQQALQEAGIVNAIDPELKSSTTNSLGKFNTKHIDYTVNTLEHFNLPR